jgi:UDP-2,3-diacylglucosamine pyrophosphatase LpxH
MNKIRVLNDVHLFGVEEYFTFMEMSSLIATSMYPVYLAGDIVDIANCKYSQLDDAMETINFLAQFNYIGGNHECNAVPLLDTMIHNEEVMICHGDIAMWDYSKWTKFRSQKWGAGWFKRNLVSKLIHEARRLIAVRPNDNIINWIEKQILQNPNLRYFVFGHSHPEYPVRFVVKGRSCVILPQGCNDLEFKEGKIIWTKVSNIM